MSARATETDQDIAAAERASRETARQETASFETPRPKSVPPAATSTVASEHAPSATDERAAERRSDRSEKKTKAVRQETKPFAVVRDAAAAGAAPDAAPREASEPRDDAANGPDAELGSDAAAAITMVGDVAGEARDAARSALGSTGRAASAVRQGVSRRLGDAQAKVEEHLEGERAEWRDAEDESALPDVNADEPLVDLAVRIDREADFWRAFAIRSLRPGGPRNVAIAAATVAVVAALVLGVVGAFGALLGVESAGVDLVETALALSALLLSSVLMAAFVERTRRDAASRALARAEVAERRLERVAAILELKKADEPRYREALARLERDPTR